LAGDTSYVKYVIDGDTVILKNNEKLRFIGIDAPEIDHENKKAQPWGYTSREFNKKLLGSKKIRLEFDHEKRDHYNRLLSYVFLPDGTFINLELLRSGLATYLHKPPNLKYAEPFMQAQRAAMSENKGIWHAWSETGQVYRGNRNSKRFHLPRCRYGKKTAPANRVSFSNQWDAYWEGYSPCQKCLK
jgi:endonuclease YncB( thermonuclease family)